MALFIAISAFSQKDEVVFTYGNKSVSYDEFKRGFLKNQSSANSSYTQQDVNDYLNLYINFKLKVQDAYDRKFDTMPSFKNELAMYRKQIAKPFLTDKSVTEHLMQEAYERMKYEVDASHILIVVKNFDNPLDTLRARKYLDSIRNLIVNGKMDFATAATKFSEDPSAKYNKGELGYFTAFEMVYPFESMAYNTKKGEVSPVFKTDFGYHILKVNDKRPSMGEIKVSHIMIKLNQNATQEEINQAIEKANSIYSRIKSGEKTFEEMVKLYSEDNSSTATGGELGWFKRTSQYPKEFKDVAFDLKNNGDISIPVKTDYGVHIIKRVDLKPLEPYDKMVGTLTQKINRDSRSQQNTMVVYERVSKELKLTELPNVLKKFIKSFSKDTALTQGKWKYSEDKNSGKVLYAFADKNITVADFAKFIEQVQSPAENADKAGLINKYYNEFKVNKLMTYYEENLEDYNPEFKYLLQEYKEGILLFSLMDEVIWTKSMQDSAGLEAFFQKNKDQYRWGDRFDATVFITSNKEIEKKIIAMISKGLSNDSIINLYKKADPLALSIKKGKFSKGEDSFADMLFDKADAKATKGNYFLNIKEGDMIYIVRANQFLPPSFKELDEVRGHVTGNYQNLLEQQWVESLKVKYPVHVNQAVVDRLLTEK
ncbi:MAG: peptidylprolyl isomerase [Bacteroidia bacterium]|nr:peptidylprolyl isomerase [Bacteroidia bacterium]